MKQVKLLQGDSFSMVFALKSNGDPQDLQRGEELAVGFYDEYGNKYIAKTSLHTIKKSDQTGYYTTFVGSDVTKNFIGNVDVEIAVYDSKGNNISHSDNIIKMFFDERKLNNDI